MPGYSVSTTRLSIGGLEYAIRGLSDKQQYSDPGGAAELAGISSAQWPLFGVLWPAGAVLAQAVCDFPTQGKRVLEIGCGLALSSLALHRRGVDITASDRHPLAGEFLQFNAELNGLPPIAYQSVQWSGPNDGLGKFDLIIGADVLYETEHVGLLAAFFAEHCHPVADVLITDPGRNHANALSRAMQAQGFTCQEARSRFEESETPPFRGRLLSYSRGSAPVTG